MCLRSVCKKCLHSFFIGIEGTGYRCCNIQFGIISVVIVVIAVRISLDFNAFIVLLKGSNPKCISLIDVCLSKLFIREVNQIVKNKILKFVVDQFCQRVILAPVHQNAFNEPIYRKFLQIHIDLDGDFCICNSSITDADFPHVFKVRRLSILFLTEV